MAKANAHLDSVQLRAKYAQAKSFTHNELEAVERETAQLTQLVTYCVIYVPLSIYTSTAKRPL